MSSPTTASDRAPPLASPATTTPYAHVSRLRRAPKSTRVQARNWAGSIARGGWGRRGGAHHGARRHSTSARRKHVNLTGTKRTTLRALRSRRRYGWKEFLEKPGKDRTVEIEQRGSTRRFNSCGRKAGHFARQSSCISVSGLRPRPTELALKRLERSRTNGIRFGKSAESSTR
jgi:hypothetical protein